MLQVCVFSKNPASTKDLLTRLKEGANLAFQVSNYRPEVIEYFTNNRVKALVLIDDGTSRDISLILKSLPFSLNPKDTQIIILANDLTQAVEVFQQFDSLKIHFISMHSPLESMVKEIRLHLLGETSSYSASESDEAMKFNININFLKVFIDASRDVVMQMSGDTSITHQKPMMLSAMNPQPSIAVRGKLQIESEHFNGSFFICFPLNTYLKFVELILGEKRERLDDDIKDLVLELTNIVYGQSKRILNSSGHELKMKIPTFFDGKIVSKSPIVVIPYVTKFGPFYIKVAPNLL